MRPSAQAVWPLAVWAAALVVAASAAQAQGAAVVPATSPATAPATTPAAAPATPPAAAAASAPAAVPAAQQALIDRLIVLQQPGLEQLAAQLVQRPAVQLLERAAPALQRLAAERRDATRRAIDTDLQQYLEATVPLARERARALAGPVLGQLLAQRFTESELQQIVATLENPAWRKYQSVAGEVQNAMVDRLVADLGAQVDPRVQTLQRAVAAHLNAANAPAAPAAPAAPSQKPSPSPASQGPKR